MSDENKPQLDDEDLARVNEYLSGPVQRVKRKPFRPLLLLFWLWVVVAVLGSISVLFGKLVGVI